MDYVLECKNLTKKYKEHLAVDNISFDVKKGEFFAFLGENGAGKSTTINMLCTILEKTSGEVDILGNKLGKNDDDIRDNIGIIFQNSVLDNKLTVSENLYTRGAYYGLSKKTIKKRIEPFLDKFELGDIMNRPYEKLSGGQRRRVDITRALINNPKILFLDEPTTGLDPASRKAVWDYIDYLRKEKEMTIFLTTHYMEETRYADNVVILDKGKIVAFDTPNELKKKYVFTKLFWYTKESDKANELLKDLDYTYQIDHYLIKINEKIPDITQFLYDKKDYIKDYEIIKGDMDDVFLNITGKKLGD